MSIFEIITKSPNSKARTGILNLPRGKVQTPIFMPIGTAGSVKGLTNADLIKLNAEIILGNTYHLWLKPDVQIIQAAGGLNKFNDWSKPILTDSGGFQAFSLSKIRKFTEDGVTFRVAKTGEKRFLSPEISMRIQTILGSDIALVLDEALAAEVDEKEAERAMYRTRRWAERSKKEFAKLQTLPYKKLSIDDKFEDYDFNNQPHHKNLLFGIPQGAQFPNLRKKSAELTMELDFPGYSIGGVANGGEPEEVMYSQVLTQTEVLEDNKPRHLLGVGTPKDLVQMVARGIDMFDCVYPTRNARHGTLFFDLDDNTYEAVHISASRYTMNFDPINPKSDFEELRTYTRAYLCHLFRSGELLAYRLATLQNLEFYIKLMHRIRSKINDGSFDSWWKSYKRV